MDAACCSTCRPGLRRISSASSGCASWSGATIRRGTPAADATGTIATGATRSRTTTSPLSAEENTPVLTEVLDKSFEPAAVEQRWYQHWESAGYFRHRDHQQPAYCIQLPPPNVTGTLHMGHAFQQTLMDALIRYHRMRGFDANWVVGTDHAGIATEIVVTRQLEEQGKGKRELGREEFNQRVWQWKQQCGSTITR